MGPKSIKLTSDARAFLPAALEIIETPPSPTGRLLAMLICLFVLLAGTWGVLGKIDIVAVASGKVVPNGHTQVVQAPDNGIVTSILARVGQSVHKGERLVGLEIATIEAEISRAKGDLIRAQLDQTRLEAFLSESDSDPFANLVIAPADKVTEAKNELEAQRMGLKSKLSGIDHEVEQRTSEIESAKEELQKATDILPLIEARAEIRKKSYETSYGSLLLSLDAAQQVIETKSAQRIAAQKIAQATASLGVLSEKRNEMVSDARRSAFSDLTRALAQKDAALEALNKAEHRLAYSSITSPIEGSVSQISIHSIGAVVTTGQQLMTIVPNDAKLEIEAVLPNREAGFVKIGQDVELKIDAFPFTRYGLLKGHVLNVSSDAEPQPNGPENYTAGNVRRADSTANLEASERLVYLVKISIDDAKENLDSKEIQLIPGMSVRAEIKTGKRSIASYVLSPLAQYLQESIKER